MRLIAFITEGAQIKKILEHIGVDSQAPTHCQPGQRLHAGRASAELSRLGVRRILRGPAGSL